jgi:eukaryotic-like serine/threonine-protein kinase
MQRIITQEEPPKPSTRMSTLREEEKTVVAKNRGMDAGALRRGMQGDLDWIVMKCLEKDRKRRYETSNGLAADLRRHLSNELISARPPTTGYLLKKLIKRNKMVFVTAAVVATSLAVGVGVAIWSLARERVAHQRAEMNFQTARRVVDESLGKTARELENDPEAEQIRRKLLEDVVNYYQTFMAQNLNDPALKFEVAKASTLLARQYQFLGRFDEALASAEKAIAHCGELIRRHPKNVEYRHGKESAHLVAGAMNNNLGRYDAGRQHYEQALTIQQTLLRDFPHDPTNWIRLASRHVDVGNQFGRAGLAKDSLAQMRKACDLYQQYRNAFPEGDERPEIEAFIRHWLGSAYRANLLLHEAELEFRQALPLRRRLGRERPQSVIDQYDLAHILSTLADLLVQTGRADQAEALLLESVVIKDKVIMAHPDGVDFMFRLTADLRSLAEVVLAMNRAADAEQHLRRALALDLEEEKQRGARFNSHLSLSSDYYHFGALLYATGRREEAQTNFSRSFEILEAWIVGDPQNVDARQTLAWRSLESPVPPWRDPARALLLAEEIQRAQPDSTKVLLLLGVAQLRVGQAAAARSSLDRSIKLAGVGSPTHWLYLALASQRAGEPATARDWYEQATRWIEKNKPGDSELLKLHDEARELLAASPSTR